MYGMLETSSVLFFSFLGYHCPVLSYTHDIYIQFITK